jgi:hypothetical protein
VRVVGREHKFKGLVVRGSGGQLCVEVGVSPLGLSCHSRGHGAAEAGDITGSHLSAAVALPSRPRAHLEGALWEV